MVRKEKMRIYHLPKEAVKMRMAEEEVSILVLE